MKKILNKRAQVGETLTWTFATLIILFILIVSVFLASLVGREKTLSSTNKFDVFADKSLVAYLLTKDSNGNNIYNQIKNEEQLNDFNGNLAKQIFNGLYGGYYSQQVFLLLLKTSLQNLQMNKRRPGKKPRRIFCATTGPTSAVFARRTNN